MVAQKFSPSNERGYEAIKCVPLSGTILLSSNNHSSTITMQEVVQRKEKFLLTQKPPWPKSDLFGQENFLKNQPQSGRQVTLFSPSLGFISLVFVTNDRNHILTNLTLLLNNEIYWLMQLGIQQICCLQAGLGPGVQTMSPVLCLFSVFWLPSECMFHSGADFLHVASCSLQAIFLTAHVLKQNMILSQLLYIK